MARQRKSRNSSTKKSSEPAEDLEPTDAGEPTELAAAPSIDPATLNEILEWMIAGNSDHHVMEAIAAKFPGRPPLELAAAVADHLATIGNTPGDVLRGWCLEAYRELYRRMFEIGDYSAAARIVKDFLALTK